MNNIWTEANQIIQAHLEGCKTLEEWNRLGYRITKGSHCKGFIAGQAVFSQDQCYLSRSLRYSVDPDPDSDPLMELSIDY